MDSKKKFTIQDVEESLSFCSISRFFHAEYIKRYVELFQPDDAAYLNEHWSDWLQAFPDSKFTLELKINYLTNALINYSKELKKEEYCFSRSIDITILTKIKEWNIEWLNQMLNYSHKYKLYVSELVHPVDFLALASDLAEFELKNCKPNLTSMILDDDNIPSKKYCKLTSNDILQDYSHYFALNLFDQNFDSKKVINFIKHQILVCIYDLIIHNKIQRNITQWEYQHLCKEFSYGEIIKDSIETRILGLLIFDNRLNNNLLINMDTSSKVAELKFIFEDNSLFKKSGMMDFYTNLNNPDTKQRKNVRDKLQQRITTAFNTTIRSIYHRYPESVSSHEKIDPLIVSLSPKMIFRRIEYEKLNLVKPINSNC